MSDALLVVEELTFGYDQDHIILDNLSFRLPRRGVTVLTGPNGAGKSTLLHLLTGIITVPSPQPRVWWLGRGATLADLQGSVGLVSTVPQLFNGLTGRENLAFGRVLFDEDESYVARALDLCALLGLGSQLDTDVVKFSSGMRQKVWLALLLARSVPLYLLDEPFNTLDADSCRALADHLLARPESFVLVAHQLPDSLAHCPQLALPATAREWAQPDSNR